MPLTGREKATIFLSILGAETSARVLRYLPDELADLIAAGINHLPTPSPEALEQVLGEFNSHLALPKASEPTSVIEERKPVSPFVPKKSYAFLMYERPQMVAYLVSLLPEDQREAVLLSLPKERAIVEGLLSELKKNPLSDKLEAKLREQFSERLFS